MLIETKVPSPGESITEVQISRWLKSDGDFVEKDEEICEVDSDKATLTISAEADGILKILVAEGETIPVGKVICTIQTDAKKTTGDKKEPSGQENQVKSKTKESTPAETNSNGNYAKDYPSVAAKKLMDENSIRAEQVTATGKGGRITKADVLGGLSKKTSSSKVVPIQAQGNGKERNQRREKLSMLRKKIAQRLVAVKNETAMLTTFNEVDMSAIMDIRKKYKDKFKEKHQVSLGFMSFFTKAITEALKLFPPVNAMIDGDEIIYHEYADIGIAVSTPKGLMVPVIRNAESLGFAGIETIILELATKAREGKISIEEITGGTFTITNGGVFGSMLSTPIINPPQSAILGMHNIVERAVVINGKIEVRPIMYVALSYDHRIIDGRESVSFLVKVKEMLENPVKMLSEGEDPIRRLLEI